MQDQIGENRRGEIEKKSAVHVATSKQLIFLSPASLIGTSWRD
jgi:hypothetical protein